MEKDIILTIDEFLEEYKYDVSDVDVLDHEGNKIETLSSDEFYELLKGESDERNKS